MEEEESSSSKRRTPQISITDAHGHVRPHPDEINTPVTEDPPSAFHWRTPTFGLPSMFSQYAGFNLANIPTSSSAPEPLKQSCKMPFTRCSAEASIFDDPSSFEQAMAMCSSYNGVGEEVALLTQRTMSELLLSIKHALDTRVDVCYEHTADNRLQLHCNNLQMEMEICQPHNDQRGLKFRLIHGEDSSFMQLRNELLSCMQLQ
jgi:hypothetical protein